MQSINVLNKLGAERRRRPYYRRCLSVRRRSTNAYFVWWWRVMARTVTAATVFRVRPLRRSKNSVKHRGPEAPGV